jgi:hypothetical protein
MREGYGDEDYGAIYAFLNGTPLQSGMADESPAAHLTTGSTRR